MAFAPSWTAEILAAPPMIAPARQFVYPMQIAGEEDALGRGALLLMVKPYAGGSFLATCALGFKSTSMPTGVFACPNPQEMCAVAGGYAYLVDTLRPEHSVLLGLKPVVTVLELEQQELLIFTGFHTLLAWGRNGLAWETGRLSWEGLRITSTSADAITGLGWDMHTDKELEFHVDVKTGAHVGGGYQLR